MPDPVTWDYAIRFGLLVILGIALFAWAADFWGRGP